MNENRISCYEIELFNSVQKLVKAGGFDKALVELREIEESLNPRTQTLERSFLYRWFSTIFNYMGDYVASLAYAEKAFVANCGPKGDLHLFGKIRLLQSVSLHRTGNSFKAIEYGKESMLAFKVTGDVRSQIASRNSLALILLDTGDITHADEVFQELSSNISKAEFPGLFDANLNNRAYAKNRLGLFNQSMPIISENSISETKYVPTKCCMCAERAFALMHLGRFEEAGADLSRLYSLATLNGLKRETILYHEYFGLLKLIVGDYTAAEESFDRALAAVPEISSRSDMVSQVNRLLAELHLAKGQWQKAHECGLAGLDVARRIPERIEIGACQRVLAQAEVELGKPDSARERYLEALELYTEFPHGYEMAKTRLCAAESGLFNQKESTEMLALANTYFTTEGLTQTSYQLAPSLQR
ncbi:tetratricopeptide repeat protein [bacterium AH-315-J21]|nr:tetratricopeptide repeat protein [bacterium AH-315-J21]